MCERSRKGVGFVLTATMVAGVGVLGANGQPAYAGERGTLAHRSIAPVRISLGWPQQVNNRGQVLSLLALWQRGVLTEIDGLDGSSVITRDINGRGQVVGQSGTPSGDLHGFVWQGGVMTDLGTLGGANSAALGINERGEVVGVSNTADGANSYFVWRRGVMTRVPTPGPVDMGYSTARINNRGQVAATYNSDEPPPPGAMPPLRILLWDDRSGLTDLGDLGGHDARLYDLNDLGQIVGTDNPVDRNASVFFWDRGVRTLLGEMNSSPPLGSIDVNNRGQVVFTGISANRADRAYLWHRGVLTDLGDLPGVHSSTAAAINERGDVTGNLVGPSGLRGYVWRRGVVTQLDVFGANDNTGHATGMNDDGMVVGISFDAEELGVPAKGLVWYTDRRRS
ncbi:hypothetical protein I0C86_16265 [Plantactinospora sp. S1510]|uniref:HAF repeat-containing protein n=1 Tax=Plantactinospora alkalitolerans TaxID=2789879 RepID=A0ABS0GWB3_9ACTN|nr:hypothetical protein [Plantactinospora alkalitolerans]MBF9130503.1 hypothetical protein [Plantactinospora alkalitolerans]